MSKLEELIEKLCPNGVEYKELGELGKFYGGITGKSKEDFKEGNAKFITYKNVYSNPALDLDVEDKVRIYPDENQRILEYGDVIFTGSSETPDECGFASVLTKKTDEKLYLNSFCFIFRFNDVSVMLPDFSKHLFRCNFLRYQIGKTASGVTRFNVSKKLMAKVKLPVPPLEVQREIVRILDNFTFLTTELAAELAARQKQYEYYRDLLLMFKPNESTILNEQTNELELSGAIRWMKLGDTCLHSCSGATPKKSNSEYYTDGTIPWIRTQDVVFNSIYKVDAFITEKAVQETGAKWIPENCVIVAISGASAGRCAINKIKATTNQHCLNMEIDSSKALYKYVFYCLCNQHEELLLKKQGARGDLNSSLILGMRIPVPPLEQQQRIVDILDRFDALCTDISCGLPAEIEARQKQYEYYRDKLLTFKELKKEA